MVLSMIPKSFEYCAPTNLREALTLLSKFKEDAKILAGGHSLIPMMKLRLLSPKYIIDINRIKELSYIKLRGKNIFIGALTRHYEIEGSDVIKRNLPILAEAAGLIGDPQVRNMGTIGGSLAHADPAADYAAVSLALNATIKVRSLRGERKIPAQKFFLDTFTTALKPTEILTEVIFPLPPERSGGAFAKFERKAGDFATVAAAVQITLDQNDKVKAAGIGLAAAGPKPIKAVKAEKLLIGKVIDEEVMNKVAEQAKEESDPISDIRGSSEYKKEMVKVFVKRALKEALNRAKGG